MRPACAGLAGLAGIPRGAAVDWRAAAAAEMPGRKRKGGSGMTPWLVCKADNVGKRMGVLKTSCGPPRTWKSGVPTSLQCRRPEQVKV